MDSIKFKRLYALIAVLIGIIAAIVGGILSHIDGSTLAAAFMYAGGAFVTATTVTLGLMSVMGLFDPPEG